jgi:hypothetical protein
MTLEFQKHVAVNNRNKIYCDGPKMRKRNGIFGFKPPTPPYPTPTKDVYLAK